MKAVRILVLIFSTLSGAGTSAQAQEVRCANGVYRAGCVGPSGVTTVIKPQPGYRAPTSSATVVHPQGQRQLPVAVVRPQAVVAARPSAVIVTAPPPQRRITCVNGVYRTGCVGPNGAIVVNK